MMIEHRQGFPELDLLDVLQEFHPDFTERIKNERKNKKK